MADGPTHYIVVTSPENWAKTAERGWTLLGLKSTKPGQAAAFKPGDTVIAYATGIKRFIAAVEVTSDMFVDHTPIWGSPKKPGEDYPNRLHTKPLITLDPDQYLDAFELATPDGPSQRAQDGEREDDGEGDEEEEDVHGTRCYGLGMGS